MTIKQGRVAFHAELMSAEDVRHPIRLEEFVDHPRSERVTRASRGNREVLLLWVRVGPNQIGDRAFVGDFSKPVHDFDLVDGVYRWGQTPMNAEYSVIDHDGQRQEVKHVCEVCPNSGRAILPHTFRIEAVRLGDGSGLVIPSDQLNSVWVSKFETRKERDGLDAEQPSVHIIAQE